MYEAAMECFVEAKLLRALEQVYLYIHNLKAITQKFTHCINASYENGHILCFLSAPVAIGHI
jgi:hypothetical protein